MPTTGPDNALLNRSIPEGEVEIHRHLENRNVRVVLRAVKRQKSYHVRSVHRISDAQFERDRKKGRSVPTRMPGGSDERRSLSDPMDTLDAGPGAVKLRDDGPVVVLAPETDWEGGELPLVPSRFGAIHGQARQLRDPALYEENGRWYLLYSVAGESGIGIAELHED